MNKIDELIKKLETYGSKNIIDSEEFIDYIKKFISKELNRRIAADTYFKESQI
jgi:hypothetical protein